MPIKEDRKADVIYRASTPWNGLLRDAGYLKTCAVLKIAYIGNK